MPQGGFPLDYRQFRHPMGARMKKVVAAAAALAAFGFVGAASAADMAVKAPIYRAPPFSWTGCYVGLDVGYAWERDRLTETVPSGALTAFSPTDAAHPHGIKGGGYVGCNWQVAGPWVLGIEGDFEGTSIKGSQVYAIGADTYDSRTPWEASIRGRLGYAWDNWLLYVTGGAAFANIREDYHSAAVGTDDLRNTTRTGWTLGGGLDYAFTANWIGRIEYRYADFGTFSNGPPLVTFGPVIETHKVTEQAVRIGIAYKFGM